MKLSPTAISAFQTVYRQEYGEEIPASQAEEIANRFINMVKEIYQPMKGKYENQT